MPQNILLRLITLGFRRRQLSERTLVRIHWTYTSSSTLALIVSRFNRQAACSEQTRTSPTGKWLRASASFEPWVPDGPADGTLGLGGTSSRKDEETFGSSAAGWDQFATNAKLFGAKTDYDEDLYTTKLNRSAANFKQREAEAERLAKEILNVGPEHMALGNLSTADESRVLTAQAPTENPHVAEERGRETTGLDEEDR